MMQSSYTPKWKISWIKVWKEIFVLDIIGYTHYTIDLDKQDKKYVSNVITDYIQLEVTIFKIKI